MNSSLWSDWKYLRAPIIFLSNHEPYCHSRSLRPPFFRTSTVTIHTWNMINVVQEKAVRPSQLLPGYMKFRVLRSEFLYDRKSCALIDNSWAKVDLWFSEASKNTSRIDYTEWRKYCHKSSGCYYIQILFSG